MNRDGAESGGKSSATLALRTRVVLVESPLNLVGDFGDVEQSEVHQRCASPANA
jgi:hypothetical protein